MGYVDFRISQKAISFFSRVTFELESLSIYDKAHLMIFALSKKVLSLAIRAS